MATWLQGTIIENRQWCDDLFSLKIKTDPVDFTAGQFIRVALDIDNEQVARPYSLVNTPQEPLLEIHFNTVENGILSPRLAALKEGDSIQVADRTAGFLTVNEVPDVPHLWLLATGTGIGPFLSILKTAEPWERFKKIILGYSVKTPEKLAYRTDFEALQQQHPDQFCFVPFVTREKATGTINTRMTTSIESGEFEQHAGVELSADTSHVMLCGNADMISNVKTLLEARSMRRHLRREPGHIATEKYY
ncbi:MAG TPA: ferredoxin--NADP reductase [Gammaproteobacteria bacterium]|nr:ferredoxin--NADP reductase [Gammaproteobacteria bacterium]